MIVPFVVLTVIANVHIEYSKYNPLTLSGVSVRRLAYHQFYVLFVDVGTGTETSDNVKGFFIVFYGEYMSIISNFFNPNAMWLISKNIAMAIGTEETLTITAHADIMGDEDIYQLSRETFYKLTGLSHKAQRRIERKLIKLNLLFRERVSTGVYSYQWDDTALEQLADNPFEYVKHMELINE